MPHDDIIDTIRYMIKLDSEEKISKILERRKNEIGLDLMDINGNIISCNTKLGTIGIPNRNGRIYSYELMRQKLIRDNLFNGFKPSTIYSEIFDSNIIGSFMIKQLNVQNFQKFIRNNYSEIRLPINSIFGIFNTIKYNSKYHIFYNNDLDKNNIKYTDTTISFFKLIKFRKPW